MKRTNWNRNPLHFLLFLLIMTQISAFAQENPPFPAPKSVGEPAALGLGVQRTMTLLSTSTPQHRNTVKILFYGQSITEQTWSQAVADDLKRRFPNANLVTENRALGGFSSQRLVKTAETDLYSFYPDLMIFHVYGAHTDYEDIIRRTRERTTSEVLIQTDHVTQDADLSEETDPAKIRPEGAMWNSFMNYVLLPNLARKYGCGMVDQRNEWKKYLRANNLHAAQLLRDGVHLNDWGNFLMAELVKAYLVRRSGPLLDPFNGETVRTLAFGKDIGWKNGKLSLNFEGNRVDVVAGTGKLTAGNVLIDGRKPSAIPELYGFTRALSTPGGKWPVILKMSHPKPLQLETWTMQVAKNPANDKQFSFTLSGSKTGPDGAGLSDRPFVSPSGRIVIDPLDWDVEYALGLPGIKPIPDKFEVKWQVVPHFADQFVAPPAPEAGIESVVTLAQGLKPGSHTLEISGAAPIAAIRIYKPPVAQP